MTESFVSGSQIENGFAAPHMIEQVIVFPPKSKRDKFSVRFLLFTVCLLLQWELVSFVFSQFSLLDS